MRTFLCRIAACFTEKTYPLGAGAQFTCFTGAKVRILTRLWPAALARHTEAVDDVFIVETAACLGSVDLKFEKRKVL